MKNLKITLAAIGTLSVLAVVPTQAQIIISEVDPTGSSTTTYAADWFELTNEGSSAVSLSGWKMDDSHATFSTHATALDGVSSIAAGQSVVFIESTGTTAAAVEASFESAWFGSSVPSNFVIGDYSGSSIGLSSSGDAVNIYNSSGVLQAGVSFGTATSNVSFDNSVAQITNTGTTDGVISTLSVVGTNAAFKDAGNEIGSPGAVPEPSSWTLAVIAVGAFGFGIWRKKALVA